MCDLHSMLPRPLLDRGPLLEAILGTLLKYKRDPVSPVTFPFKSNFGIYLAIPSPSVSLGAQISGES